jgi:phospholipid/cholesterol/gamma-HCH transport system substrate-binding protein
MRDRVKNILIGGFVSTSLVIGISMVLFFKPQIGDGKKEVRVRFISVAGITSGTRVTYAGKPVGEVVKIQMIPDARDEALDEHGKIYTYEVILKVDSSTHLFTSDEVAMRTTGLMGERSVAIIPHAVETATPLTASDVLLANSVDPFENTVTQIGRLATKAEKSLDQFDSWFKETAPSITLAVGSFHQALSRVDTTLATVESENLLPAARQSLDLLSDNLKALRSSLVDEELLSRLSLLTDRLSRSASLFNEDGADTLHHLSKITGQIANGNGTVGRLLQADDFYLRVSSLLSKADTLMNDINHYGILFQYDKGWKRSRTRRANLLNALETPDSFRTFFESEVDAVTTSLGRLSELLDRAGSTEEREKIQNDDHFKRDFALLLRKAQALTDALKLYNEALVVELNQKEL